MPNISHSFRVLVFFLKNILETEVLDEKYDIIVSNPPYVRNLEKEGKIMIVGANYDVETGVVTWL